MATTATITPTLGSAPVTLQAGNYSAIDDRRFWSANFDREGVLSSGSYQVIQRAAGANMTVDVQSSSGSGAVVTGDSVTAQGRYFIPPTAANVNVDIATADATNPRNDLVILEVKDDQHDASGLNLARVRVVTGTPNASAALTDAPGANGTPALPSSAHLLAVVRVAAGATSIATAAINDRREYLPSAGYRTNTPTLTAASGGLSLGSGGSFDQSGKYTQVGKVVTFHFRFVFGTSAPAAGTGAYSVGLPVTASGSVNNTVIGTAYGYDSSTNNYAIFICRPNGTTAASLEYGYNSTLGSVGAAAPWTWAASDQLGGVITYEAA